MSSAIVMTETGGPEVLQLRPVALPVPGPGQVCVAVHAIGVNPVETYWRAGTNGRNPKLPYTPGQDAAGVVHAVGAAVKGFKVGDRVFTTGAATGTYAHHCLVDPLSLHHLPAKVSFEAGAALGTPALAAYRGLITRGQAKPCDRILVHGATGGVGTIAVQLAVSRGMTVVGTADDAEGVALIKQLGAAHAFIHTQAGYFDQVKKCGPFDVIVECLANVNLAKDLEALAPKGRVTIVGSRGPVQIDPRLLMVTEADVRGVFLTAQTAAERNEAVAALLAGLTQGTIQPVIAEVLPLADAGQAHRNVVAPKRQGKIILRPKL